MQLRRTDGLADTGQVNRLPARHALKTGGLRQHAAQLRLHAGGHGAVVGGQQLKGQRLQRIAGQQSLCLTEAHMHGGLAAAQHIVVHARHVVMHQRVSVDQLDRASCPQSGLGVTGHGLAGGQHQQGPQAFAPVQHGVAHGITQAGRGRAGLRAGHPVLQGCFNPIKLKRAPAGQVKRSAAEHLGGVQ